MIVNSFDCCPRATCVSAKKRRNGPFHFVTLCWFDRLFKALEINTRLEVLSLSNTGLTDRTADLLTQSLEKNSSLRVLK